MCWHYLIFPPSWCAPTQITNPPNHAHTNFCCALLLLCLFSTPHLCTRGVVDSLFRLCCLSRIPNSTPPKTWCQKAIGWIWSLMSAQTPQEAKQNEFRIFFSICLMSAPRWRPGGRNYRKPRAGYTPISHGGPHSGGGLCPELPPSFAGGLGTARNTYIWGALYTQKRKRK